MRQREIKFRFWHSEELNMYPWDAINIDADGVVIWRPECFEPEVSAPGTLLQYTGLKDKDGREIYEGDVVKVRNWTPRGEKPTYSNILVEWVSIGGSDDMGTDMIGFRDHSDDEVIGNIYENPELLA